MTITSKRTLPVLLLSALSALAVSFDAAPAAAQSDPKEWSLQKFRPAIHSLGGFTTEAARVSHEFTINAYLMANVAGDMLQDRNDEQLVDLFGSTNLLVSAGFLDHLSFGLDVPFHFGTGTFLDGDELGDFTVGDMRLSFKATALKPMRIGPGIGLAVDLHLPTGSGGGYGREDGVVVVPKIVLDAITPHVHLMTNLWVFARSGDFKPAPTSPSVAFGDNLAIGPEAGASIAAAIFLGSTDFRMLVEGRFESRLSRFFEPDNTQLEFTWGLHWKHNSGFAVGGGASFGVLEGYGDPTWRGFLTIGYQPNKLIPIAEKVVDSDGDGIMDDKDQCPRDPEDKDGFEDEDGCPDNDNDKDGILDGNDKCPNEAEDKDGDRDEDGCPDGDKDADGIADDRDQCPDVPEDKDGFEDTDGCPDPDNDKDGIADATDKCPDKAEDFDGCQDEDGCPEDGKVCVTKEKITISEKIFFQTGKATILPKSYPLLAELSKVINENPQIELIEIQGHTDSQGRADFNMTLSDNRANSVMTHLVTIGQVDPRRLIAKGYGQDAPIADNKTAKGRELNRRVEFMILRQKTE